MNARPGGRSARVRDAVLTAVYEELAEVGYPRLTVDNVANRAGVHKTTVYRRWGSVDVILVDALHRTTADGWRAPDTGTVEGDLVAVTTEIARTFGEAHERAIPSALVAAAFQSPLAAEAMSAFYAARQHAAAELVVRGVDRGELPRAVDPVEVVRAACGPLFYRIFITREPVDTATARRCALAALAAARAGVI
ncbi:TetR/AcrR family transcriptional regulator [Umezawaea tangerina]|uniref:TetR/AcrR family transcriptional regulator n=1 Tax=Umezawaea tangerina TaxID=84725 RepID=UPI000D07FE5D|nr:TetR/AcrR family transcriptional regulator [Umezawaea tangerina]